MNVVSELTLMGPFALPCVKDWASPAGLTPGKGFFWPCLTLCDLAKYWVNPDHDQLELPEKVVHASYSICDARFHARRFKPLDPPIILPLKN